MKSARIISVCVLLSFIVVPGNAQTGNWPKTLLWKIERSDLKKPSFLFGTMHLQDKRLFNLGDSFYHYFEKAEGFAIEVNFNEYIDSLLGRTFNSVEEEQLNDGEEGIVDVKIDTASNIEMPPPPPQEELKSNKYFKKYFRKIRNERARRLLVYGEMPTILDAYLYGMAMKQGKWLGAVEEVKDQLNLMDEFGKDVDEDDMNETEEKMMFTLDNMIKIYLNKDLDKIEQYAVNGSSSRMKAAIFTNRNVKMAHSIDSLSHSRSMFYAVGAAHLPGDSGVIKLLRAQGYTVTPVYSTTTLAAEKYAENLPALSWRQVAQADSLYTIEMPGIPTDYNMFGDLVKMKVLVDMTTMTFFMTGHTISQFDESKLTDVLKGMAQSMGGNRGKLENVKQFEQSGLKGVEGQISGGGVFFKVQVLTNNSTAFFLLLGSNKKTVMNTPDAGKFFTSFRTNGKQQSVAPKDWALFDLPEKAFSVSMPGKPKRNKIFEKQAQNSGWNFTVYD
ncbi:MAG: TraB/GumN family protein, partial [Chitinophagaceae bacterium]|nr:TraB/GumN family protein [Chitinophagaceae bacterium]